MKRSKARGTGKFIRIVLQVSMQKGYEYIRLGHIYEIVKAPSKPHGVWIQGTEKPVFIWKHEFKRYKYPVKRTRKRKVKVKRRRRIR